MQHQLPPLETILAADGITTHFQPLVSVRRKCIIGFEALSRGLLPPSGDIIPPVHLFGLAKGQEELLRLDRACRESAMANFAPIHRRNPNLMLSINIDAGIISRKTTRSGHLLDLAEKYAIPHNNVIIEIIESKAADTEMLIAFVKHYKDQGFLIALDDVGAGHSNLDRIPLLKPDILKFDRSLIKDIHQHHHKQSITDSLVRMASRIGAVALAEGVEQQEEVVQLLELGVEFYQGFHFARPESIHNLPLTMNGKFDAVAATFKAHMVDKINRRKKMHRGYAKMVEAMCSNLISCREDGIDACLRRFINQFGGLECVYVLDQDGIQVSDTVCDSEKLREDVRFLYQPAQRGTDHSLKDYFLPIKAGLKRFTTAPYISLASGNPCLTIATSFMSGDGGTFILCADIDQEENY